MSNEREPRDSGARDAFDTWQIASPVRRSISFILDNLILLTVLFVVTRASDKGWSPRAFLHLWVVSHWIYEGLLVLGAGATVGQLITKIRFFSPRTNDRPTPLQMCLRVLSFWMSFLSFGLGLSPIFFRRDRRAWHDIISETVVVGPEKSIPGPAAQEFGHSIVFVQALLVIAILGAYLFSTGANSMKISGLAKPTINCNSPHALIDQPSEVLMAMIVSPAWSSCWGQMDQNLGPLQDSEIANIAKLATQYHMLWLQPKGLRAKVYSSLIRPTEDELCEGKKQFAVNCKLARDMASITAQSEANPTRHWLSDYREFLSSFSKAENKESRISALEQLSSQPIGELLQQAIQERIWAENFVSGELRESPISANPQWNQDQACWLEALKTQTSQKCGTRNFLKNVQIIKALENNNVDQAEEVFGSLEQSSSNDEMDALIRLWKFKKQPADGGSQDLSQIFLQISPLSPNMAAAHKIIQ